MAAGTNFADYNVLLFEAVRIFAIGDADSSEYLLGEHKANIMLNQELDLRLDTPCCPKAPTCFHSIAGNLRDFDQKRADFDSKKRWRYVLEILLTAARSRRLRVA